MKREKKHEFKHKKMEWSEKHHNPENDSKQNVLCIF